MYQDAYVYEKASYVPDALARLAEDLKLLDPTTDAFRDVQGHLDTALRYALRLCCAVTGAAFDARWVSGLVRQGHAHWKEVVKPALDAAIRDDASEGEDAESEADGDEVDWRDNGEPTWDASDDDELDDDPDDDPSEAPAGPPGSMFKASFHDSGAARTAALTLSALADLTDVVRKHGFDAHPDAEFTNRLASAFNGATKAVTETIGGTWDTAWPDQLAHHGREALAGIVSGLRDRGLLARLGERVFDPIDEAWLSTVDPERSPDAERAAERTRRAQVTKKAHILHDLVPPNRYRGASLSQLLVDRVPGHDLCAEYARAPKGSLVLHGELFSGLHAIQWAIGRHWFVEQLWSVAFVDWNELVGDNLMAQSPGLWTCPFLLVGSLCPVSLWSGGGYADPGYAERMLEHRLLAGLPTVITVERYGWEHLNLRSRTIELLKAARNVTLPRLDDEDRKASGLET